MQKIPHTKVHKLIAALLLQSALDLMAGGAAADERQDRQEYQAASIELQNTLQKNPADREARQRLGLLGLEWGNGPLAEKELRRAIELGVPQESLQFPLAEALLMQGKHQEILDYLAPVALMSAGDQAKLLAYRGDAWLGLGQTEKAKTEYETALHMEAGTPLAKLGLARIALADGRVEEAQRQVSEALALAPNEPKAWSLQGALFETTKQADKAEESYGKAIGLKRFKPVELASRAIIRINANNLKGAQADLDALRQEAEEFFLTYYTEALLDLRLGRHGEAQTALEKALKMNDRFESVNYYLGIAHLYQNHDYEAEKYLADFMGAQPQALEPRLFMAMIRFRAKNLEAARNLLAPLLEKQPDNEFALKLMSDIEFADGNHGKGFAYLDRIPKVHKPPTKIADGMGLEVLDGKDKRNVLAKLDAAKKLDARLTQELTTIVLRQMAAKDFGPATEVIEKIGKKAPDSPVADNLLGLLGLAKDEPDKAQEAFEAALEKSPGNPVITHELAQLAVGAKKTEVARKLYEKALRAYPKDMSTRVYLAELDLLEGKPKAMEERLTAAIQEYPTALQPRMVLASHFLNAGDPGRAAPILEGIQQGYPDNLAFMTLLIHTQIESHEPEKAVVAAKVFVQNEPQYAMAHYLLARAYAELHDTANLRKALDQAMAVDPKFLPARYTQVKMLAGEKKMQEAEAALEALAKQYPDSAEVMALRGWLADTQGRPADAVAAYKATFARFPGAKSATDLAKAEWKAGAKEAAMQTLEGWAGQHPGDAPPRLMAAEFYAAQNKEGEAIRHLEAVLQAHPENVLVMNNLAWLYRKSNPEKALEIAQWALALAPKSIQVMDTLAMVELDRGQAGKALKLLKRAAGLAPQHKPTQYHLAMAMDQAGQRADAAQVLRELLADPRPFPGQEDAKALLDKLSDH